MGHPPQPQVGGPGEGGAEQVGGKAGLGGVEPDPGDQVEVGAGGLQRVERRLRWEVAQEAQDQQRRHPPGPGRLACRQPVDHGGQVDPPLLVGLGVEEDLGMAHPVGDGPVEVGHHQVLEVALGPEDAHGLVVDVEE